MAKVDLKSALETAEGHARAGRNTDAARVYAAILKAHPRHSGAKKALARLKSAPKAEDPPAPLMQQAIGHYRSGNAVGLKGLLQQFPNSPGLWNLAGLSRADAGDSAAWAVAAEHASLGRYRLSGRQAAELGFCDNETNAERLFSQPSPPFCKDGLHRLLIDGDSSAVNPAGQGTKVGAVREIAADPGETHLYDLRLSAQDGRDFDGLERTLARRRGEADVFFDELQPRATTDATGAEKNDA